MVDKLTHAITVKVTEQTYARTALLAKARGMEVSEYIRHLMASDMDCQREVFELLQQVFADDLADDQGNKDSHGFPVSRFHL